MARNRKSQSGAVWLVPALKTVLLCLLLGGSAVGYVLQKNKIYDLGRQMREKEVKLERLKWENKIRAHQLANLQLPRRLDERVREQRLGLSQPHASQMIWLPEPVAEKQTNQAQAMLLLANPAATQQ